MQKREGRTISMNSLHNLSLFSLQEFEAEYQELWDWLMDMDTMVTDSHQLMMSEEQRHHLFKVRRVPASPPLPPDSQTLTNAGLTQ